MTVRRIPTTRAELTSWAMNDVMVPAYMVSMSGLVDATALRALRDEVGKAERVTPSYTALVIRAAAQTMRAHPEANRIILGWPRRLYQFDVQDISVAVETSLPALPGQAYATPIVNAGGRSATDVTRELRVLATATEQTHAGYRDFMRLLRRVPRPLSNALINLPYLLPSLWLKYRGCAAWVNAPSKAGADYVITTWPWPITFSFGLVKERPYVLDSAVVARWTMPVVMVFDRRIMAGGPASRVFATFQKILTASETLR